MARHRCTTDGDCIARQRSISTGSRQSSISRTQMSRGVFLDFFGRPAKRDSSRGMRSSLNHFVICVCDLRRRWQRATVSSRVMNGEPLYFLTTIARSPWVTLHLFACDPVSHRAAASSSRRRIACTAYTVCVGCCVGVVGPSRKDSSGSRPMLKRGGGYQRRKLVTTRSVKVRP